MSSTISLTAEGRLRLLVVEREERGEEWLLSWRWSNSWQWQLPVQSVPPTAGRHQHNNRPTTQHSITTEMTHYGLLRGGREGTLIELCHSGGDTESHSVLHDNCSPLTVQGNVLSTSQPARGVNTVPNCSQSANITSILHSTSLSRSNTHISLSYHQTSF